MIQRLYDKLAIPETCYLGKRVFKKLFHENAQLGITDKKAFRDDIDTITWVYTLKSSTITIHAYRDDVREYDELALLQVDLKTLNRTGRIAEIIHRAIPYPLVIVFLYETTCAISMAHKRYSQAEKGAIVAEEFITTDWIDLGNLTDVQQAFLDSITLSSLPQTHFYALYTALLDCLIALKCATLTGVYRLEEAEEKRQQRRQYLAQCHELEVQIAEHKAAIKKEPQFNHQVELNTKIKQLENQLHQKAAYL